MEKDDIRYFAETKRDDRNRNLISGNDTEKSLCGQLMLLCTVFLTAALVTVGSNDILPLISFTGRILLVIGLFFVLLSIAAGIRYYFILIKYYQVWAKNDHDTYQKLRDITPGDASEWNSTTKELNALQKDEISNPRWLLMQIACLGIAAIFFGFVILGTLFDFKIH